MKVSGFTLVRNAIKYDYPIVEAIQSILPLCDEVVVAVGNSDDGTLALIKNIPSPKIKIIETVWDDSMREGGRILAVETDKAWQAISPDSEWAFYIQGDEVLHEKYLDSVKQSMAKYKDDNEVEGLLFNFIHFYGSYHYIGESHRWYRREVRVMKTNAPIFSYRDAQGFRKKPNDKLKVKLIDAFIFHYGYVREPSAMQLKQRSSSKYWHDDRWVDKNIGPVELFDYSNIDALTLFQDTHPQVMEKRMCTKNWTFEYDISKKRFKFKDRFKRFVEQLTGWRPGEYRNYKII